ncbi:MAG TPA: hypothetical protein VFM18_09705, partial [Methanosarcina sp.]|nr:hypothetical protein [Methanosarcina sp.]
PLCRHFFLRFQYRLSTHYRHVMHTEKIVSRILPFDEMKTNQAYHGIGFRYNEPSDPPLTLESLLKQDLYFVDSPLFWNSPHLTGEDALVLYLIEYRINRPIVMRNQTESLELLGDFTVAKMLGHDSVIYIPESNSQFEDSRQGVLFNPHRQVIRIERIERGPETFVDEPLSPEKLARMNQVIESILKN